MPREPVRQDLPLTALECNSDQENTLHNSQDDPTMRSPENQQPTPNDLPSNKLKTNLFSDQHRNYQVKVFAPGETPSLEQNENKKILQENQYKTQNCANAEGVNRPTEQTVQEEASLENERDNIIEQIDKLIVVKSYLLNGDQAGDKKITLSEFQVQDFLQDIFLKHCELNLRPKPKTKLGSILFSNGKFVLSYIDFVTKHEKNDFLKKYLLQYFYDQKIINDQLTEFKNTYTKFIKQQELTQTDNDNQNLRLKRNKICDQDGHLHQAQKPKLLNQKVTAGKMIKIGKKSNAYSAKRRSESKNKKSNKSSSLHKSKSKLKVSMQKVNGSQTQGKNISDSCSKHPNPRQTQQLQEMSNQSSMNSTKQHEILGSCYHYELKYDKKKHHGRLQQKRTSARLSKKKNPEHRQSSSVRKSSVNSKSVRKSSVQKGNLRMSLRSVHGTPVQKKHKDEKERNDGTETNSADDENVELEFVKKHFKELEYENIQLYEDYRALTKNDKQITSFLMSLKKNSSGNSEESDEQRTNKAEQDTQKESIQELESVSFQHQKSFESIEALTISENGYEMKREHRNISIAAQQQKGIQRSDEENKPAKKRQNSPESYKQTNMSIGYPQSQTTSPGRTFEELFSDKKMLVQHKKKFKLEHNKFPLMVQEVIDPDINGKGIYAFIKLSTLTQIEMGAKYAVTPLAVFRGVKHRVMESVLEKARELAGREKNNIAFVPISSDILRMIEKHGKKNQR